MDELIKTIRDEGLVVVMDQYSVGIDELAEWCEVTTGAIGAWRNRRMPDGRVHQVAYEITRRRAVDGSGGVYKPEVVDALRWYANHVHYSLDATGIPGRLPPRYSSDALTVYRRRVMNDRGARARQALKEAGHEL